MARRRTIKVEGGIEVAGLRDITRGLKRYNAADAIKEGGERSITPIVNQARRKWMQQRIKPQEAAQVIRGNVTRRQAGIVIGYRRHPYAAGVEFGSHRYRQFRPWSGNRFTLARGQTSGYVVLPTVADRIEQVKKTYAEEVTKAIMKAIEGA